MDLTTGYPYWLINSGLPAHYEVLERNAKTDVVIIGGGISGALTAYYLIQAGIPCLLVDKRTIGLGSTCASTSLLQYELDKPLSVLSGQIGFEKASLAYRLCSDAIDKIRMISQRIGFEGFEQQYSLFFAASKKDKPLLENEFLYRKRAGFEVSLLGEKEIRNAFGFHAPTAILSSKAANTDAYLFTHALLKASIKKGLSVYDRTGIAQVEYQRKGAVLHTDKGLRIHANYIVNATGYEITEFIDKKIVKLHATYAFASEHMGATVPLWDNKTLLWNTADPYLYMRLTSDHRVIVGGRDELYYNPSKRDKLIKRKTILLKRDFNRLFPHIDLRPEFSWTGTFGSTHDSLPYIGAYAKTPHTYYALGFGGNGITFSIIAARIIRDLILGKRTKEAALFSFER